MLKSSMAIWSRWPLMVGLILLAVLWRVLHQPFNITPIGAIALLSGSLSAGWRPHLATPFLIMFASDAVIGFHSSMWAVYSCLLLSVVVGYLIRGQRRSPLAMLTVTLACSTVFFLVTNFAVWIGTENGGIYSYSNDWNGLMTCYAAGLPFFRNAVIGDLAFMTLFYGVWGWIGVREQAAEPVADIR